ncbi:MAG: hypothetical protein ACJ76X_02530 [Solirubrobacteraceae bacterium]
MSCTDVHHRTAFVLADERAGAAGPLDDYVVGLSQHARHLDLA